ncbi:hypothetical protein LT330_008228 [Penicillium expansum]|nr:hypothetical protein LT330_008228 [Penicillium expansum]
MRPFVPCHAFWNPVPDTILAAGSYGIIPPQLPAQFNVCFQLTGSGTAGALLISSHKVTSKQLDRPDYQKQWAYGNARAIREADDDVSIHGFFLVEKIWTSPEAWTAAFQSQDRGGTIAFNANVYEAAGVDIGRKWFCSSISQGGNHRSVEELTGLLDEADRHPHDDVFYQIEDSEGKPIAAEEFNRLETTSSQAGHTRTVTEGYDLVGLRLSDVPMIEPPEMAQEVDRL